MTETTSRYGPPLPPSRPPARARRRGERAARAALSLVAVTAGTGAALVSAFAGFVVWTDCLFGCGSGGNPPAGLLLLGLAAVLLLAGGWGAHAAWRARTATVRAWLWVAAGLVAAWLAAGAVDDLLWRSAVAGCPSDPSDRWECARAATSSWPSAATGLAVVASSAALAVRAHRRG